MMGFGLVGSSERVHGRVEAIRTQLEQQGHSPQWFIISQRRYSFYNMILRNAVKKSNHLKGEAIDLYIIDINGDGVYDIHDFELINAASKKVGRSSPRLKGEVFDYLRRGFFSRRMVHVE